MYKTITIILLMLVVVSCTKQKPLAPQENITYSHWYETRGGSDTLFSVYIPNAFSPNGDGWNDEFYVKGFFTLNSLKIIDKYNNVMFETTDRNEHWRGAAQKNKYIAPQGNYINELIVFDKNGKKHEYTGGVMVMR